jgi:hypothetical protein
MNHLRRIIFIIILSMVLLPRSASAERLDLEINANSSDIEAKLGWEFTHHINNPQIGAGVIYSDNYWISNLSLAVKDKAFIRELNLGLGFKGLLGEVEDPLEDFDLRALSFLVLGEYDFKNKYPDLPMIASMSIAIAPHPLSFSDTSRYLEYTFTIYLYIVRNAAIDVGYRGFDARFEDTSSKVKRSDDAVFLGFKLDF